MSTPATATPPAPAAPGVQRVQAVVPATAPGQPPQPRSGQDPQPVSGRSIRGTSAERVLLISLASVLASLLVAIVGFVSAQNQAAGMERAATSSDRVLTVMAVRSAILEADGAATNAFLVGGLEPQDRRMVYDEAVAEAARLLAQLAGGATSDADLIAELNADLTTYTSLVEAARVNNRQGFPVGVAYLEQASALVRDEMLPDLDAVLRIAADDAAADFGTTRLALVVIGALLAGLAVLVVCQVMLARMTHRRLNPGLALATVLLVVAFLAGGLASESAASSAAQVRTDTYRPTLAVAQAGVMAAEARTLESLTLIKRGSGQAYEEEFVELTQAAMALLEEQEQAGAVATAGPDLTDLLSVWLERHAEIRALDDGGDWEDAVELAITDDEGGPSAAYAAFAEATQTEIEEGSAEVTETLRGAASGARWAAWALAVCGVLAAFAGWRGTAARREEYR